MLLVEITINSVVNRVSVEGHALTYNWKPRILEFDAPTLGIPSVHGGYAKVEFGKIIFNPLLFQTDWPPPMSCPIKIYYTDTTEAARELVFSGTAHLCTFDRTSITYDLKGPSYDEIIADATAYNDTLNVVIWTILLSIPEITSVNAVYARVSSPNVTYTTSGDQLAIALASSIAQFYSHLIYIVEPVAFLVDMKRDNGSRILKENQFFAFPSYKYEVPVSKAVSGDYSRFSAYPYGNELSVDPYHTTQANIETALDDILALANSPRTSLDLPMVAGNFPNPGEKIIISDTGNVADISAWMRVRKIQYDFINHNINVEGEGEVSAG